MKTSSKKLLMEKQIVVKFLNNWLVLNCKIVKN